MTRLLVVVENPEDRIASPISLKAFGCVVGFCLLLCQRFETGPRRGTMNRPAAIRRINISWILGARTKAYTGNGVEVMGCC